MPSVQINYGQELGGVLSSGAGIVGGSVALSGALASGSALGIGAATAGIGAAVVGLVVLLSKLFKGADRNEAVASNIMQIFESAKVNLEALAGGPVKGQWGSSTAVPPLISRQETIDGLNSFKQACLQYEAQGAQQTGDPRPFQNGMTQIQSEIDNDLSYVSSYGVDSVSGAVNFSEAHTHYVKQGYLMRAGQYGNPNIVDSALAAAQVTDTYLQTLNRTIPNIVSNAATGLGNVIANAVGTVIGDQTATATAVQGFVKANPIATLCITALVILILRKVIM